MPIVKTISPGRLTGVSGLTKEAARQIGRQKDIEYQFALQDWRAEKTKLEGIKQDQLNYLDQKMKTIAGEEQAGGETFDEGFKKAQMQQAKEYASIVSDIKLGNIDPADGYAKLAVFDQSLKNIETAIPNINAFSKRIQEAMNKEEGEVGAFVYDGSGKTFEIAQLFNDMFSPTTSGNVSTVIEDGKTFLVHKDGQKISIEGLNAIMSGENPDYPINFVEDPREALKAVHDVMMKENESKFKIRKGTQVKDAQGRTITTKKDQFYLKKGSNYDSMLKEAVVPILDDDEKMKGFWLNLGGEGNWENSDEQRRIAQQRLVDMARNSFGPKNDVLTIDVSLPKGDEEDGDGDNNKPISLSYKSWIDENLKGQSTVTTNMGGQEETRTMPLSPTKKKVRIIKKFISLNPDKYASGQVLMDANVAKKGTLEPNALYTKDQYGRWNIYPNFENLLEDNEALNEAFIGATPKKKKAYN
jgi:hypothetical protein